MSTETTIAPEATETTLPETTTKTKKVSKAKVVAMEAASTKGKSKKAAATKTEKPAKAEKKTKDAPATRGARAKAYQLFDESVLPEKISSQALFVIDKLRANPSGLTKAQITAAAIKATKQFVTNQPHDRAVGFYLSKFKNLGALRFVESAE